MYFGWTDLQRLHAQHASHHLPWAVDKKCWAIAAFDIASWRQRTAPSSCGNTSNSAQNTKRAKILLDRIEMFLREWLHHVHTLAWNIFLVANGNKMSTAQVFLEVPYRSFEKWLCEASRYQKIRKLLLVKCPPCKAISKKVSARQGGKRKIR